MKKRIIKLGNSQGILFTKNEMNDYGMIIGDVIDIDDMLIQKLPKIKSNKKMLKEIKKEVRK